MKKLKLDMVLTVALLCLLCAPGCASKSARTVSYRTSDGWKIVGDLYAPKGRARGLVVLLHQRGGQAADWDSLATALQKAGFEAVAIDQRGAGRSTQGPGGSGDEAPWDTQPDIAAVLAHSANAKAVLVGASYGANNALIYAAAHPQQVRGVALLSPGANYHGLDALAAARRYRGPVAIYHYRDDNIADGGPGQINALLPGSDHALHVYPGSGHGVALLGPRVNADIVRFCERVFR